MRPNEQVSYSATGGGPSQGWSGGAGIPVRGDQGDDNHGDDDHGEGAPVVMIMALVMVWR